MMNRLLPAFLPFLISIFPHFLSAQIDPVPKVSIVGPSLVCSGDCVTLEAVYMNIPQPVVFSWTGPGGFTSNAPFITVCPPVGSGVPSSGLTYFLTVGGPNGGIAVSDTHVIKVLPFIPINIVSSNLAPCNSDSFPDQTNHCEKTCPNTSITYSLEGSYPGNTQSNISWNVTGASSYTINNPPFNTSITVNWGNVGFGSVSVVADGNSNCSGQDAICVNVIPEPVAKFTTQPSNGAPLVICKDQTVYFNNQSLGADSYEWYFNDDLSNSSLANPQHTFHNPGMFLVTLVARSACLCADTTTLEVYVLNATSPNLDCIGTLCPGEAVTYTASNGCAPFSWNVSGNGTILGGGQANSDTIRISWTDGPLGIITLNAQACTGATCPTPATIQIPVLTDNAEISGKDHVCPGSRETYTIEPYNGTNFVWSVANAGIIVSGQGTNSIVVEWPGAVVSGQQIVSVQYQNCYLGCNGQDSLLVSIVSPFVIDGPVELCEAGSGVFNAFLTSNNQALNCNWTLYAPNGSTVWNSVAPASSVSPPFTYNSGLYSLRAQTANSNLTCTNEAFWTIQVAPLPVKPTGIKGATQICPGTSYSYTAEGAASNTNIIWTIQNGPGAPSTAQGNTINVTWNANGPRWIAASTQSTNGLNCISDTTRIDVQPIVAAPIVGDAQVCINTLANYSIPSLQNVDIQWQISPASAAAIAQGQGTNASQLFWTEAGGHVVSVNVCGQTSQFPVTVLAAPLPNVVAPSGLCAGASTQIKTSNTFIDYTWYDVNGSFLSNSATPTLPSGSYTLRVSDANGCVGTTEFSIDPRPQPNLTISTADATGFCNNSKFVTLTALGSTDLDYTYQWFQDGNPVGGNTQTFITNQYGNYTVSVTNFYGCTASAGPVLLFNYCGSGLGGFGIPGGGGPCPANSVDIAITPTAICDSFQFKLLDLGGIYAAGTAFWQFGQSGASLSGTSNSDATAFKFSNAGKYIALLSVQLTNGSTCYVLDSVAVRLHAQFDPILDCPGANSTFKDLSTLLPFNAVTSWNWNFGDPASGPNNSSFLQDPGHVYAAGGFYQVTLTLTEVSGCTSSQTQQIEIPAPAPLNYTPPTSQCTGNALEFNGVAGPDVNDIYWDFGDPASGGANMAGGATVYHNYNTPGPYTVTAFSKNAYGCTASFIKTIVVQPNPLSGTITPSNPAPICEGKSIVLNAPVLPNVQFLWSNGHTNQSITVDTAGSYRVTLTDTNGCSYATPPVTIHVTPAPDGLIKAYLENALGQVVGVTYPSLAACYGEDVHLVAVGNGAYNYTWSNGAGQGNELVFSAFRGNLLTVGSYNYTVTITDNTSGCTAVSDPFVVDVHPVPGGFSIGSTGICANTLNTINYTGPNQPNWQYIWNNGQIGQNLQTDVSGAYFLRVVNEFGCESKSNTVVIRPGPPVAAIPAGCHTRCTPDTLCFPNLTNILTWQWYYNGNPIAGANSPNFVAQQSGTYWLEMTDNYNCSGISDPLTLNLYQGTGNVAGSVWSDVNNNGVIDPADTLVSGIPVQLLSGAGAVLNVQNSINGVVSFANVPSTQYSIHLDPALLPANWDVLIGNASLSLTGCDNSTTGDLLVKFVCTPDSVQINLNACPGKSANYNGTAIPAGASAVFTYKNQIGCDSVVTVVVKTWSTSDTTLQVKACPGSYYNYKGTHIPVGTSQSFTLINYLGCDSIVTVVVSAYPNSFSTLNVKVCGGATYNYFGTYLAVGQTANFTFSNYLGCDSTVTIKVAAYPPVTGTEKRMICYNDTLDYYGSKLVPGDTAVFTLSSILTGCDSIVTITVDALPTDSSILDVRVCPKTTYEYAGQQLSIGTTTRFVLSSTTTGCDSVVLVTVGALPQFSSAFTQKVCPGEVFLYQNQALVAGDSVSFTLQSVNNGCDSVVTVKVIEKPTATDTLNFTVCPGTTYDYNGTPVSPGAVQSFVLKGFEGCDSTVVVQVSAFPDLSFSLGSEPSCDNKANGALEIYQVQGGAGPYTYSLDGQIFGDTARFSPLLPGDYTLFVQDANDCVFERDTSIEPIPVLGVSLTDGILPCDTSGVRLSPEISPGQIQVNFLWSTNDTLPAITALEPGIYWVEVRNACELVRKEARVQWADLEKDASFVYVPNVIAPSASRADNATFHPFFPAGVSLLEYRFEVFDRWGNKLFHSERINEGWDGGLRSQTFKPGVCVWYMEAKISYCGRTISLKRKGDVTLVE